ncbi:MAG: hypothetical protein Q9195_009381 [Heterodermia aff. obscurata]
MPKNGNKVQYPKKTNGDKATSAPLSDIEKAKEEKRQLYNDTCEHKIHHCPYCKSAFNPTFYFPSSGCVECKEDARREIRAKHDEWEAAREADRKAADEMTVFLTPGKGRRKDKPRWTEETRARNAYG